MHNTKHWKLLNFFFCLLYIKFFFILSRASEAPYPCRCASLEWIDIEGKYSFPSFRECLDFSSKNAFSATMLCFSSQFESVNCRFSRERERKAAKLLRHIRVSSCPMCFTFRTSHRFSLLCGAWWMEIDDIVKCGNVDVYAKKNELMEIERKSYERGENSSDGIFPIIVTCCWLHEVMFSWPSLFIASFIR